MMGLFRPEMGHGSWVPIEDRFEHMSHMSVMSSKPKSCYPKFDQPKSAFLHILQAQLGSLPAKKRTCNASFWSTSQEWVTPPTG